MQNETHILGRTDGATIAFETRDGRAWPQRLFRHLCGADGNESSEPRARGPATIHADDTILEGDAFTLLEAAYDGDGARLAWSARDGALRLESHWKICHATGIVSRRDRLVNQGRADTVIRRCLSRFTFQPAQYEIYVQDSRWCMESQGRWLPQHAATLTLGSMPGRFTNGSAPYFCLREVGASSGLAFHILPNANWTAQIHAVPFTAVLELGLSDRELFHKLAPGAALELPEILVQDLPGGRPEAGAPSLHAYAEAVLGATFPAPPVVYNTWFDLFAIVDPERLRAQLAAAADLGCEVFVIDDGWYGRGVTDTTQIIGDWHERDVSAFHGQLKAFGDEVRAAGLGFGLWVEPEGAVLAAPIRQEHPEWFCGKAAGRQRIDLENPDAAAWFRDEMCRVIETYELAWLKVDLNFDLGRDERGKELAGYFEVLRRTWDEIRVRCPDTFIEGCASGAMRLDLESLKLCDAHFPSDSIHPTELVQIAQGTLLRIPPGRLTRWIGVRSIGSTVAELNKTEEDSAESIVVPGNATWEVSEKLPLDYAACAAVPGIMGLTGDPASLGEELRVRLRWYIAFHKSWRAHIRRSVAHLLTPPCPIGTRTGWTALQLQDPATADSLIAVHHLHDGRGARLFRLRELDADQQYTVTRHSPDGDSDPVQANGRELMDIGMRAEISCGFPRTPGAGLYSVRQS